jgi:hypothetical protein
MSHDLHLLCGQLRLTVHLHLAAAEECITLQGALLMPFESASHSELLGLLAARTVWLTQQRHGVLGCWAVSSLMSKWLVLWDPE